jgi:adenine-specific DNA-methyltransferase
MYYPIYVDPVSHSVSLSRDATFTEEVLPKLSDGVDGRWRWGRDTVAQRLDELCGTRVGGQRWDVSQIDYAETDEGVKRVIPKTVWTGSEFANESGTLEVKRLLGKDVFTNPKPIGLVAYMLEQAVGPDDIVLDFFAGSGTTAHAVMLQNATDGGSRRYILVQLPEPTNNPEFPTIADITKERIRRVIASLSEETSGQLDLVNNRDLDRGFRVFKLDSSNIRAWDPEPDNLDGSLLASLDHLKEGRTEEDIFYELLLKLGLDLTIPIECRTVAKKTIYSVGAGTLIACLAESIDRSEIEELALGIASWRDELQPAADTVVVFRDSAFADDVAKTNITAILEQHGMPTVRSL